MSSKVNFRFFFCSEFRVDEYVFGFFRLKFIKINGNYSEPTDARVEITKPKI